MHLAVVAGRGDILRWSAGGEFVQMWHDNGYNTIIQWTIAAVNTELRRIIAMPWFWILDRIM